MLKGHAKFLVVTATAALTASCLDLDNPLTVDPVSVDPAATDDLMDAAHADAGQSMTIHDNFFSRVSVAFSVESSLRSDASVVLRITAAANADATGGTVRVVLPTKAAIQSGSARRPRSPLNTALPSAGRWQLPAMSEGDTWTQTVTIGQLADGYYQVAVFVDAQGTAQSRATGGYMTDEFTGEAWVAVKPEGGKLTEVFDRSVFADSIAPMAGPFRVKPPYVTTSSATSRSGGDVAGDSDDPVELEITYLNLSWQQVAAVGAEVLAHTVSDDDEEETWPAPQTRIVPSSGVVSFPCPPDGYYLAGSVGLPSNSDVGSGPFLGYWEATQDDCGETQQYQGSRYNYLPWDHLKTVVPRIESHLDHGRSQISWRSTGTGGRSSYDRDIDQIIFRGTFWRQWTAAHEFGHAIHATNLGGLWNTTNCTNHNLDDPSSYTCAFSEGFADYVGNIGTPGADQYDWDTFHRSSTSHPEAYFEGNVAALFHDLIDGGSGDDDDTSYSGEYVTDVFATCKVRIPWLEKRNDVSDFVWCLENDVEEDEHEDNFPGLTAPTSVQENADEPSDWDAEDIRATWLQNVGT